MVPRPERLSCDCIDRRVGRTSLSRPSQSLLLPHVWAELNHGRVRNDHHPDQRSHGHRDERTAGAGGHRKVGIDEGCQPHRWLATTRLTMLPGHRPRLRRTQPCLPIRGPQLRARSTKMLGPTLDQHVELHIITFQNPRSGSSPPGNQSDANCHSHDHRGDYHKAAGATNPRHGHSMRHPETVARVGVATRSYASMA